MYVSREIASLPLPLLQRPQQLQGAAPGRALGAGADSSAAGDEVRAQLAAVWRQTWRARLVEPPPGYANRIGSKEIKTCQTPFTLPPVHMEPDEFRGVLVCTIFLKGPGPEPQVPCELVRG